MIAYLKGTIIKTLPPDEVIVEINGIGYKVGVGEAQAARHEPGDEVELFTHLVIRENSHELYGFTELESLQMFELLITISGVGPKMTMGVLAAASPQEIKDAIATGNSELFRAVSGIGKKNAGRIILELRSKLEDLAETDIIPPKDDDVVEALKNLGYSRSEISTALKGIDRNQPTETQLTEALRALSR